MLAQELDSLLYPSVHRPHVNEHHSVFFFICPDADRRIHLNRRPSLYDLRCVEIEFATHRPHQASVAMSGLT
jgi:hypothetical protein